MVQASGKWVAVDDRLEPDAAARRTQNEMIID
jgi:hypothetical protein